MTKQTPKRTALSSAIAAHAKALNNVQVAEDVLEKANTHLSGLQDRFAEFDGLDQQIESARADELQAKFATGEEIASLVDPPSGFAAATLKRDHLEAEIAAARSAIKILEGKLAQAEEDVAQRDYEREAAAECVIIAETEQLAIKHLAKLATLRKEHYILANLVNKYVKRDPSERVVGSVPGLLYGSGGVRKIKMSAVVINAATQDILGDSERSGGIRVRDAVAQAVNDYWQALKADADATLHPEPKPSKHYAGSSASSKKRIASNGFRRRAF